MNDCEVFKQALFGSEIFLAQYAEGLILNAGRSAVHSSGKSRRRRHVEVCQLISPPTAIVIDLGNAVGRAAILAFPKDFRADNCGVPPCQDQLVLQLFMLVGQVDEED